MARVLGFLLLVWKTQTEFQVLVSAWLSLHCFEHLRNDQQMGDLALYVSVSLPPMLPL